MAWTVKTGEQFTKTMTFTDASWAVDITWATVFFIVKTMEYPESEDDDWEDTIIKIDITDHTDAENGITSLELTTEDTDKTPGVYFYEFKIVFSNGDVRCSNTAVFNLVKALNERIE